MVDTRNPPSIYGSGTRPGYDVLTCVDASHGHVCAHLHRAFTADVQGLQYGAQGRRKGARASSQRLGEVTADRSSNRRRLRSRRQRARQRRGNGRGKQQRHRCPGPRTNRGTWCQQRETVAPSWIRSGGGNQRAQHVLQRAPTNGSSRSWAVSRQVQCPKAPGWKAICSLKSPTATAAPHRSGPGESTCCVSSLTDGYSRQDHIERRVIYASRTPSEPSANPSRLPRCFEYARTVALDVNLGGSCPRQSLQRPPWSGDVDWLEARDVRLLPAEHGGEGRLGGSALGAVVHDGNAHFYRQRQTMVFGRSVACHGQGCL